LSAHHPLLHTPHLHQDEVTADLACGKCFIQGATLPGAAAARPLASLSRPLLVVLVARHSKAAGAANPAPVKRFVCWCLDVAAAACDPATNPGGAVCGLFDFSGVTMDSLDIPALKEIFSLLQQHFPERLDRLAMFGAPPIFTGLWRLLTPFLDAKTKAKVCFVGRDEDVGAALPHVSRDALPAAYGGRGQLVSIADAADAVGMGAGGGKAVGTDAAIAAATAAARAGARPASGASAAGAGCVAPPQDDDEVGMDGDDGALEAAVASEVAKCGGGGGGGVAALC